MILSPTFSAPTRQQPASSAPSLNRTYTQQDLANYVNSIGRTNGGDCKCNNVTLLCDCSLKVDQLGQYQSFQVSTDVAALVVQEIKKSENLIFGNINNKLGGANANWPPRDPIVISKRHAHNLGSITGREEPLFHLQTLPEDVKIIDTKFFLFTSSNGANSGDANAKISKETPIPIGYESASQLNEVPAHLFENVHHKSWISR